MSATRPLRIGLIATCTGPVREDRTGSVESLVWLLARELTALGQQVTVFGCAGSEADAEVVTTLPGPYGMEGGPTDWQVCEWLNLGRAVEQSARIVLLIHQK